MRNFGYSDLSVFLRTMFASVADNLISACGKCNKLRGNMEFADWIKSAAYERICTDPLNRARNKDVLPILDDLRAIVTKPRSR